ncbi:uncharacterized protein PRCAT00001393001 [Priceomyces carsonii]|uniref:uncharacterized protein n=1 Tax=Priceomyces carsonii TaxID=28549 RepID=UPI002EDB4DF8|nr:unnamed protein product [Priceomyces carsonii]
MEENKTDLEKVLSGERLSVPEDTIVPGTVHIVDIDGNLNVKKSKSGKGNIILQPQPSDNPNDPLRWKKLKKHAQFWLLWWWAFLLAVTVNWSGPIWTEWTELFNCTYMQLNISSALSFLFLGVGCIFLQPTAMKLGRRFVYLLCTVLAIVANIIGGVSTNVNYLYAANVLGGLAAAPVDSLVEISTMDVFFQHERAEYLSWFILALYAGSDLGPVACGYIVERMSWRWCYWIQVIIFGVLFVIQLFFMEDTTFYRGDNEIEENILQQIKSEEVVLTAIKSGEIPQDNGNKYLIQKTRRADDDLSGDEIDSVNHSIPKRTYLQKLRLIEIEYNDPRTWPTIFIRPFFLIPFPAILWGGLVYGSQMMWLSLLATTQSEIYAVSPYYFSTAQVGLTNIGALVGSILGMVYGGKFVDWLTIRLAIRNKGILEPEFRLWAMVLPALLNAAGLLAYGLGSVYEAHWAVSVVLGQGFLGFAMGSSGGICLTYTVDSYAHLASEGLVLMLFIRNCIGMGFTFAIQPWLDVCGLSLTTWLMFMISLVINCSFILMVIFGKRFRRMTLNIYHIISEPTFGEYFKS